MKRQEVLDTTSGAGVGSNTEMGPEASCQGSSPEGTRWACEECPPRGAWTLLSLVRALKRPASSRCVV